MAQMYSFIDANGETRLLAEIHPAPSFDGGTVTQSILVEAALTPGDQRYLDVLDDSSSGEAFLSVANAGGGTDGNTSISGGAGGNGNARLTLFDANLDGAVTLATDQASTIRRRTGSTGVLLTVQVGTQKVFEVRADGSLHGQAGKALTFDL